MSLADRYDVEGPMGEGGFAHVYRGLERATGRPVALKVLKSAFHDNPEVRERFQREVFAVASLSNPHIVGMYDFGLNEADVYIAMEYVEGLTLRERLRSPLSLAQRFAVVSQIGEAIFAAHERNIVHRDLKPENIKVVEAEDGSIDVKVLDFGMAKITQLESQLELQPLTRAGICFGTPHYMSPEQIRGKLDDTSIDLYALTTIAYELLAGFRPWDGEDPYEVMRAVLRTPAPVLTALYDVDTDTDTLARLNAFFTRALDKTRENRPAHARELVAELEHAMFGDAGAPALAKAVKLPDPRGDTSPLAAGRATEQTPVLDDEQLRNRVDTINDKAPVAADAPPRSDSIELTVAVRESKRPIVRPDRVDPALRAETVRAAKAFGATQKRSLLWPLLLIAIVGGSLGYLLAGQGTSPAANHVHDFLVGTK